MIISTYSTSIEKVNHPGTKMVGVMFKLRDRMKNSLLCAHVPHRTLNLVSSCCFAEDSKEMYQKFKAQAGGIVFPH